MIRKLLEQRELKQIVAIFLFSRVFILFFVILGAHFTTAEVPFREFKLRSPEIRLTADSIKSRLKHIATSGDSGWYFSIAEKGYAKEEFSAKVEKNWAFFPLYPTILSGLKYIFGENVKSSLVLSNLLFLASLVLLYRYTWHLTQDANKALLAAWLAALYPVSYFLSVPVTEPIFLILTLSAFFLVEKNKPIRAATLVALATATRATGFLIIPAFFFALLRNKSVSKKQIGAALVIAPLGLFLYMYYLHLITGNFLAFYDIQVAWGRNQDSFFKLARSIIKDPLLVMVDWNFIWLHLFALVIAFFAGVYFIKRKEYHFALFVLTPILVALWTGKILSIARFTVVLFPIYFYLADIAQNKTLERIFLILFAGFLAVLAALLGAQVTAAMA